MATRCLTLLSFCLILAQASAAEAQMVYGAPAPAGPMRNIHLNTTPAGVRANSSAQRIAVRTPATLQVPAGQMASITVGGTGWERLTVPIPIGSHDLHLNVRMSRPVFEAGLALTIIGGALAIAGAVSRIAGGGASAELRV